eukprot:3936704-Rhodomonas_salina.1
MDYDSMTIKYDGAVIVDDKVEPHSKGKDEGRNFTVWRKKDSIRVFGEGFNRIADICSRSRSNDEEKYNVRAASGGGPSACWRAFASSNRVGTYST